MAERASFGNDAVGLVEEPVEDRLGQGGIRQGRVPGVDGKQPGHQGGAQLGAVLDDLEQIATLLDGGRGQEEVSSTSRATRCSWPSRR